MCRSTDEWVDITNPMVGPNKGLGLGGRQREPGERQVPVCLCMLMYVYVPVPESLQELYNCL